MTNFAAELKDLEVLAFKRGPLPDDLRFAISTVNDLRPALKSFDKAVKHEERSKAILQVLKAKTAYERDLRDGLKDPATPPEKANVQKLLNDLGALWIRVEHAAQPPRPDGSTVTHEVLKSFNLAAGLKPFYLDVKATEVSVYIEIDSVLDQLIKEGKESLKIAHLGDIAKTELESLRPAFVKTIQLIEAKIKSGDVSAAAKTKEANEVLKYYATVVEDRVNKAVANEWAKYLSRAKHLSNFRIKSAVKITLGVIGIGVAAASLALSFGAAWMLIFAIVKAGAEQVQVIATLAQSIDKTALNLLGNIGKTDALNKQREAARATKEGQKASKTKEGLKELANALLPVTKLLIKSNSSVKAEAKQLLGQVSKLETAADNAVGAMNKAVKLLSSLPDKAMNDAQLAKSIEMGEALDKFFTEISALHKQAQDFAAFGDMALEAARELEKSDSWSAAITGKSSGMSTKAAAAYAAANFIFQCVKAGKSLIPV